MAVFAVYVAEGQDEAIAKLREHFPGNALYSLSDTIFLVKGDTSTQQVGAAIGVIAGSDSQPRSAIFKLNASYWGFHDAALWEWMGE